MIAAICGPFFSFDIVDELGPIFNYPRASLSGTGCLHP